MVLRRSNEKALVYIDFAEGPAKTMVLHWFCIGSNETTLVLHLFCLGSQEQALVLQWFRLSIIDHY